MIREPELIREPDVARPQTPPRQRRRQTIDRRPATAAPEVAVRVRWCVARKAARSVWHDLADTADRTAVEFVIEISADGRARADFVDPRTGASMSVELPRPAPRATWTPDAAADLVHCDIAGVAGLSFVQRPGGAFDVLYAVTPLLERLGIAGGRYERPTAEVVPADAAANARHACA